jgi:hypothetical protein
LRLPAIAILAIGFCSHSSAGEADALAISANILARHLPYGTILDPVFDANNQVVSYSRCGDSAIWTGHYLAAEAYRYSVTGSPDALDQVRRAIIGIQQLIHVTGVDLLARCAVPADSPYLKDLLDEEKHHGSFAATLAGRPFHWVANTSRDQYSGVFFGLGIAYDLVEDSGVRATISDAGTRMLERLLDKNWAVVMPNGDISTVFWGRADQQLALLAVGRRINPKRFQSAYGSLRFWAASSVAPPVAIETLDAHNSYFKFNLDVVNLFNLIRLETSDYYGWWYRRGYDTLRRTIDDHENAHFNMIDRALRGPDSRRDAETRILLDKWLARPRRDVWVDLRGEYPSCRQEDRACEAIPIERRVNTDFLWQRSPFLLYGGGTGRIETAGIDYILPYWMARYYGVL